MTGATHQQNKPTLPKDTVENYILKIESIVNAIQMTAKEKCIKK